MVAGSASVRVKRGFEQSRDIAYNSAMRKTLMIAGVLWLGIALSPGHAAAGPPANPNYSPPPAKEGFSYPDCYCTDSLGQRVEMGQTACLIIGSRRVLALCDMSVNNPAWREQSEGCPGV
jgi:hypothetical protein